MRHSSAAPEPSSAHTPAPSPLRSLALWPVAWILLTTLTSWAQLEMWHGTSHLTGPLSTELGRAIASLITLPIQASNVILLLFARYQTHTTEVSTIIGSACGWALWLTSLWILLQARRLILARLRPPPSRTTQPHPTPLVSKEATTPTIPSTPRDPSRRRFLIDGPLACSGILTSGVTSHGVTIAAFDLRTTHYALPIRGLPAPLAQLSIAHLSDTHLGPHVPPDFVRRIVRSTLALKPDLILLTGDYVHRGTDCNQPIADLFRPLVESQIPVLAVLGNHDWYGNGHDLSKRLRAIGVHMLDNTRLFLDAQTRALTKSPPASGLCIAGVGDYTKDPVDFGQGLTNALAGLPPEMPRLLLQHQPDAAEDPRLTQGPRVDAIFSGHTHGGQIALPLIGPPVTLSRYGQKYARGLARGPVCPVVVSNGLGMSFLPIRIGVPPEIVHVTLTPA